MPQLPSWVTGIAAAVVAALACFGLHYLDVQRINLVHQAALDTQKSNLLADCNADKKLTEEASHVYQTDLDDLSKRAAERLRQPAACVPITPAAAGYPSAASPGKSVQPNGLSTQWLYDYADEAEKYRLQLRSCQKFIKDTWKEKGAN